MKVPSGTRLLVRRACIATLKYENFPYPAEISVSFVDDDEIRRIKGLPVARYDSKSKKAYPEYPDGRREYVG